METMIRAAIALHLFFLLLLVGLILFALYCLATKRPFKPLSKWLDLLGPQYYILQSAIAFTGLIVMAVMHFEVDVSVWAMVVVWLFLVGWSIRLFKSYKATRNGMQSPEVYLQKARVKYYSELALLWALSSIAWVLRG